MPKVVARGESVYQCDVCNRRIRVPTNQRGLDVLHNCTITAGCKGKLNRVTQQRDINATPTLTPAVVGLQDWFQRSTLYTHNQIVASNRWEIQHNLGGNPVVHTFLNKLVGGTTELVTVTQPPTILVDSNNVILVFDQAETGVAQLETLSSQNTINANVTIPAAAPTNIQVSNDAGLITVATLNSAAIINITMTFSITGQLPVTVTYNNIDNIPPVTSPWAGISQVYVNGNTYTVRSFNILTHPAAINYFLSGQIPPQGATFYVNFINASVPVHNDILILGATSPFGSVDRVYDKYVDLGDETETSANVVYSFGKVYAVSTALKSTYPYISVV